jgi:hypothetical protein
MLRDMGEKQLLLRPKDRPSALFTSPKTYCLIRPGVVASLQITDFS